VLLSLPLALALAISVEPARLAQRTPPASARVVIEAPGVPSRALRLWASTGEVSSPRELSPGRFEASYRAPTGGPPADVVLAAWDEASGEVASTSLVLEARTELPVETEPGAQVSAAVAGRRVMVRADATGRAQLILWVPPRVRSARVTAVDAAGNATVEEVQLGMPDPVGLWIVAPDAAEPGERVRLYAFATSGARPRLSAPGARLEVAAQPGVTMGLLEARADVTVVASLGQERATATVRVRAPTAAAPPLSPTPSRLVEPRWELGASIGPRLSGSLTGGGLTVEGRWRVGRSRLHLGFDVSALYAKGNFGSSELEGGGACAAAVGELRFSVAERVALLVGAELGAMVGGVSRTPSVGRRSTSADGGPSVGAAAGLLAQAGPGLVTIVVGYAWTPLIGVSPTANLEGGWLAVGYRAGRW
jgi:hypothetical protein